MTDQPFLDPAALERLAPDFQRRMYDDIVREENRRAGYKMRAYFPDTGAYRRELYPKHMEFIAAGKDHRERAFMAANRVGKSDLGSYEMSAHLTGEYPHWWNGRVFDRAITAWAAGDTGNTVRGTLQIKLLGPRGEYGTGMIPAHAIEHVTHKANPPDAVDKVWVKHVTGKVSTLTFKSYDQRRESFQGAEVDVIWLDEEPGEDIYTECLLRTMTNNGLVFATFTPLLGMTPLVQAFLKADAESGLQTVDVGHFERKAQSATEDAAVEAEG